MFDDISFSDRISETEKTDGQIVLEENSNFQPTENEIIEYAATVLGLEKHEFDDLLWLAEEGIKAPLPTGWKPVQTDESELYYFNFDTGESSWEHPSDGFFKEKLEKERKILKENKKKGNIKDSLKKLPAKSSITKLNPIRTTKTNLDERKELDFVKNLRSSSEVEEREKNKIDPPQKKTPLGATYTDDFNEDNHKTSVRPQKSVKFKDEDDHVSLSFSSSSKNDPEQSTTLRKLEKTESIDQLENMVTDSIFSVEENESPVPRPVKSKSPASSIRFKTVPEISENGSSSDSYANITGLQVTPLADDAHFRKAELNIPIKKTVNRSKIKIDKDAEKQLAEIAQETELAIQNQVKLARVQMNLEKEKAEAAENRIKELETSLATERFEFAKKKTSMIEAEKEKMNLELKQTLKLTEEQHENKIETEKAKMAAAFRDKMRKLESDLDDEYTNSVAESRRVYEDKLEKDRIDRESLYQAEIAKRKARDQKDQEMLNIQKEDLEVAFEKQRKNLEEAHQRDLEQTQVRHQAEIQKANDKFKEIQRQKLENIIRQNEQEQEDRVRHLKNKQETYLSELRSQILNENLDYESKKLANKNLAEQLNEEEIKLVKRETEMKKKMDDLEIGFSNLQVRQERQLHEKMVDLASKKELLERDIVNLKSEKEHLQRNKERLEMERIEFETSIKKLKEDQLKVRHVNEMLYLQDTQQKLMKQHEETKDNLLDQTKLTIGRTRSDSGANSMNHVRQESGSSIHTNSTSDNLKIDLKGLRTTSTVPAQTLYQNLSAPAFGNNISNTTKVNTGFLETQSDAGMLAKMHTLEQHINHVKDIPSLNDLNPQIQSAYTHVDGELARRHQHLYNSNPWWFENSYQPYNSTSMFSWSPQYQIPPSEQISQRRYCTARELIEKRVMMTENFDGNAAATKSASLTPEEPARLITHSTPQRSRLISPVPPVVL